MSKNSNGGIASIEEIIEEAQNGRMFILVDDEDRENEGDLVIPAQMATPNAINFMASHGRGLICLALTSERVAELGLRPMSQENGTQLGTAFMNSIEASLGVTTGISAADRARTISVAIDGSRGGGRIVSPGHIFPLEARDGGVLVRAGHTEAAVDISRLAGLNPSGVICEIMRDDGEMARLDDLLGFAAKHGLKIGTIRDLIAYRLRNESLVERSAEAEFHSQWGGDWKAISFFNKATGTEQIVLQKGEIDSSAPTLVRMHASTIFLDVFGQDNIGATNMSKAMKIIGDHGSGIIAYISPSIKNYYSEQVNSLKNRLMVSKQRDLEYGIGAQILNRLGVNEIVLISNVDHEVIGLDGFGIKVVGRRQI
ncbi:MAG: 3,4-dihydroxy-2-butanone-4-phosphate synthase [Pseudomonadota bacterium]|jgi:3,4-dihydroxy 2-butanone 4-phosphate synthase/GTP cyclohydrolase II